MATAIDFVKAIRPNIKAWISDGWVSEVADYKSIIGENVSTNNPYEEFHFSAGVGIFSQTAKGASAPADNPIEGYLQRITSRNYTASVDAFKIDWEQDRYSKVKSSAMNMGAGVMQTYNYWAFNPLRAGFTSTVTYADADELFATAHARKDGGSTISNASATGIPLTYTNLETALLALYDQVDDKGRISTIGDGQITLVVPKDLEMEAVTITKSEKRSDTAEHALNYYKGRVNVLATKWLRTSISALDNDGVAGSETAWYLVDNSKNKMTFLNESPFGLEDDYTARNQTATFTGSTRFRVGPQNWRGWWGSEGANVAYSG